MPLLPRRELAARRAAPTFLFFAIWVRPCFGVASSRADAFDGGCVLMECAAFWTFRECAAAVPAAGSRGALPSK